MRFGIGQFTLQLPPWDRRDPAELYADTLQIAELADRTGLDSFWLAEHHGAQDSYVPALLPFLAAAAARTKRIELGTAVMLAPFHHPLRLAEDAAVVDALSGGRLALGLGLGWAPEEYRMFGVDSAGRGRRLREMVEVLRLAWTQPRFSYHGRFFDYEDVSVTPKPARRPHPPILLGGIAPAAVERAARVGDGYVTTSTMAPEDTVARAREVAAMRRQLGGGEFRFGMFVPVGIGRDPDDGWARIRDGLLHVRGSYALWARSERDVSGAREVAMGFEDAVRAASVCGTPGQIADRLRPLVNELDSLGLREALLSAILVPPGTPLDAGAEHVQRYVDEVLPLLGD